MNTINCYTPVRDDMTVRGEQQLQRCCVGWPCTVAVAMRHSLAMNSMHEPVILDDGAGACSMYHSSL